MRYQSLALAVATVLLSLPAFGQAGGDRRIIPSDDGFMETDLHTGAVTQCLRAPDGYRCAPAKTDPSALQAELERLRKENAELRSQLSQPGPGLRPDQRAACVPVEHRTSSLLLEEITRPMQRQRGLLLDRLDRYETHGRSGDRLADRLRIPGINLPRFT
jgi:hypothetical protein